MEQHAGFSLLEVLISLFLVTIFSTCFVNRHAQQAGLMSDLRQNIFKHYQQWNKIEHT